MNSSKPVKEILPGSELGDLADNQLAFLMITRLIAACRIEEALNKLRALRKHLKQSKDIQSEIYLLGRVELQILMLEA